MVSIKRVKTEVQTAPVEVVVTPAKPMKVLGYVRVSSQEQAKGQSVDAQKEYLKMWCQQEGWELVGIEDRDVGMPAEFMDDKVHSRPGLQRILNDTTGQYDAVIAWHNDRLSRDLEQLLSIYRRLKTKKVTLYFANLPGVDFDSLYGRPMLQFAGMFAETEKRLIGLRVKLGKARAAQKGRHQGKPFTGFKHDQDGRLIPDGELVTRIKNMMADGLNTLQMSGETGIPKSTMYRLVEQISTVVES